MPEPITNGSAVPDHLRDENPPVEGAGADLASPSTRELVVELSQLETQLKEDDAVRAALVPDQRRRLRVKARAVAAELARRRQVRTSPADS